MKREKKNFFYKIPAFLVNGGKFFYLLGKLSAVSWLSPVNFVS